MKDSDVVVLRQLSLFAGLPAGRFDNLTENAFVQAEPAGAVMFQQGEMPRFLHVILAGRVALFGAVSEDAESGADAPQREAVVEIFGAGEIVIAPAVLLDLPYLMSARTVEPTRIAFLAAAGVRALLNESSSFSRQLSLMLARHWRLLARQLKDQKLRSATQRLGSYLLSLTKDLKTGHAEIELPLDRRTLASWLGSSPESLSRSIAQLGTIGVQFEGRSVRIGNVEVLGAFCHEDFLR